MTSVGDGQYGRIGSNKLNMNLESLSSNNMNGSQSKKSPRKQPIDGNENDEDYRPNVQNYSEIGHEGKLT